MMEKRYGLLTKCDTAILIPDAGSRTIITSAANLGVLVELLTTGKLDSYIKDDETVILIEYTVLKRYRKKPEPPKLRWQEE